MPQGASKGERRGGRAKGTPNKATVERAVIAARVTAEAEMRGQRLGKEILAKYAAVFDEMADARLLEGNVVEFEKYARLACSIARDLAPYQSPTFRAVDVAPGEKPPVLALSRIDAAARQQGISRTAWLHVAASEGAGGVGCKVRRLCPHAKNHSCPLVFQLAVFCRRSVRSPPLKVKKNSHIAVDHHRGASNMLISRASQSSRR
jgi:hypothetical protein